jgi:RHS repeat-associated protein
MTSRLSIAIVTCALALMCGVAQAAAGRTAGQFGVSSVGSAQYTIPIWTPPGIRALQPRLALSYDSTSPMGILGPGWNLSGVSAITRCNRTYAQDSLPAAVTLTAADAFCLDGRRLRLTSSENLSTYGAANTTYQTEIANFSLVTASSTLAGNGPSYFTVKGKDGFTYEYGNTTDSKVLVPGNSTPYTWALDKITDRSGNYLTYTYTQTSGSYVLAQINYTALSGSTSFVYQIKFGYTTLTTPILISYIAGAQVEQTQELSTISVQLYNTSTDLRVYKLSYTTSGGTKRPRLATIQECGGSGGTDCLAATSVGYQDGTPGFVAATTSLSSGATNGKFYSVDIDGDGRQDLVFATTTGSTYTWYVQFATATGYGAPVSTGISSGANGAQNGTPSLVIDRFRGTNANQIIAEHGGTLYLYTWNGSSFTNTSLNISNQTGAIYASADVDGDGRPDLVYIVTTTSYAPANISVMLNTTSGTTVSFAAPVTTTLSSLNCCQSTTTQLFGNNSIAASSVKHMDFDGDGRDDLLFTTVIYHQPTNTYSTVEQTLLSRGTGPFVVGNANNTTSVIAYPVVLPVNWNDDACTDVTFQAAVVLSECNGSYSSVITLPSIPTIALDWDGDGRTDVLMISGNSWYLNQSLGNGVAAQAPTNVNAGSGTWAVTDANGDGLSDLVLANSSSSNALYLGLHNGTNIAPDLATSFTDGYGIQYKPAYTSLVIGNESGVYYEGSGAVFPEIDYQGPLEVVSSATNSDGIGGTYVEDYFYRTARFNMQGRGFEGYGTVGNYDTRTALYDWKTYGQTFPQTGVLSTDWLYQSDDSTFIKAINNTWTTTTLDSTSNNQRYFPYLSTFSKGEWEFGGTINGNVIDNITTTFVDDNYGNVTSASTVSTDLDATSPYDGETWTSTTVNTITPDTSTWCLGLPTETQVTNSSTATNGASITRTVTFTPDYTNCRQTQKVIEPSSAGYKVTEAFGYDPNTGNLLTDTVTGVGMAARTTTYTWNATGQFLASIENPLSQTITLGFDPNTGMKTSQTDPNYTTVSPNNLLKTTWTYDDFARKLSESRSDGTSTTWSYNLCGSSCVNSNNQLTVTQTNVNIGGTTQSIQNTYRDALDRVLVSSKQMLSGAYDRNEVQYDSLGRVHQQAMPCTFVSCATYWTTNTYDVLNRLTQSQRPISASNPTLQTTTIAYAGRTTTITDALNNASTRIAYVTGSLGRAKDAKGYYLNFTYDAFGALKTVADSASNTLYSASYNYGIQAFPYSTTDMDLGSRSNTFDALGELTAYSDAKSQNFSILYDALSRPTNRTEPDLTTVWTWGNTAASYNIGKLQSVTATGSATYSESYTYDSKTRPSTTSITIPGDTTYNYTYTYNGTTGLLDTLQYPVSTSSYQLKLQYAYAYGRLQSISDFNAPSTVFWTANTVNPRGQVTQQTLGSGTNGIVTNRSYDAVTGWLNSVQSGVGSGAGLQNYAFLFDEMGDVTQRQDNNLGLTENFYYDALYRLDHSTLGGSTNLQMVYDTTGMGNIASRSDVAGGSAWTYDSVRKHAVTQAGTGGYSFTYDANGNAQTRNGYAINWSSYNYPTGINSAGESVTFSYGQNRQRYLTTYTNSSTVENTYTVGGLLEKVISGGTTDYRHYIFAGSEGIALYSRTSAGTNTLHYLLQDHQGSFTSVTNGASPPANAVSESFTAYGNRRSGTTWSGAPSNSDETTINGITRQGYTGQTVLGVSMGLNHLNGRVEDAITGRFLSPDTVIPDLGNTQSYNRYSYVNNNPVTLTDTSGHSQYIPRCRENCYPHGLGFRGSLGDRGSLATQVIGTASSADGSPDAGLNFGTGSSDGSTDDSPQADNSPNQTSVASPTPTDGGQEATAADSSQAQGTNSDSSLDYIVVTATRLNIDPDTGAVVSGPIPGTGSLGFIPFYNSAQVDPERAYQSLQDSDAAYARGDAGEAARQMDNYYRYSGFTFGSVYAGITFPTPVAPGSAPTINTPPISISPPQLIEP